MIVKVESGPIHPKSSGLTVIVEICTPGPKFIPWNELITLPVPELPRPMLVLSLVHE